MRTFHVSVVIGMLAVTATAQTTAPQRPATSPAPTQAPARGATPPPAPPPAPPPPTYAYQAGGRRDPFRTLLPPVRTASATPAAGSTLPEKIEGLKDINVSDVTVKGVLQNGSTYIAMVLGPNGKTYVAHPGDSLRNGTIRSITPQGLVIVQDINDPLSTQRQREVRKLLRSFEEAK